MGSKIKIAHSGVLYIHTGRVRVGWHRTQQRIRSEKIAVLSCMQMCVCVCVCVCVTYTCQILLVTYY